MLLISFVSYLKREGRENIRMPVKLSKKESEGSENVKEILELCRSSVEWMVEMAKSALFWIGILFLKIEFWQSSSRSMKDCSVLGYSSPIIAKFMI